MKYTNLHQLAKTNGFNLCGNKEEERKEFVRLGDEYMSQLETLIRSSNQFREVSYEYIKPNGPYEGTFTLRANYKTGGSVYVQLQFDHKALGFGKFYATSGMKDSFGRKVHILQNKHILWPQTFLEALVENYMKDEANALSLENK